MAGRFALITAAGEYAAALGIVPWDAGEASRAAETCFAAWLANRGGIEPNEVREGIRAVRSFLSAHVTSRFLAAWEEINASDKIPNLAGFRKKTKAGEGWEFPATSEAWPEVTAGFDPRSLAGALVERGLLIPPENGSHRAKSVRIPGHGQRRVYHIPARILEGADV